MDYLALAGAEVEFASHVDALVSLVERELNITSGISTDHGLNAMPGMPSLFLAMCGERLVGVGTIFAPHPATGEIALCVLPGSWRSGIGTRLLDMASKTLDVHGCKNKLLICDRASVSGTHFVLRHARGLKFSEYEMRHSGPMPATDVSEVVVRRASGADIERMAAICAAAFGEEPDVSRAFMETSMISVNRTGYVGLVDGEMLAICFVTEKEETRSLNTLAVHPGKQGKGYGKKFLLHVMRMLPDDDKCLELEVNSMNRPAIALYRRLGFEIVSDIGYHEL